MIGFTDLLEKIEDRVDNQQDGFQHVSDGVVLIPEGSGNFINRNAQEGDGEEQDGYPKGFIPDQATDEKGEQAIFYNIEEVEVEIRRDLADLAKVSVNQLSYNPIAQIQKNNPQPFSSVPFPGEEQKNYGYKVGYPREIRQDLKQAGTDMLIFIQIYRTCDHKSKFRRISVLLPIGRDDVVLAGGGADHVVNYNPIIHHDVPGFGDGGVFQDLLAFSINGGEHECAYGGIVVGGVDAQTSTTRLGQHFLDDLATDQVAIGLVRVGVIVRFHHPGTGFSTDVLTDGRAEGAGSSYGFVYILVHGIHFGG